MITAADAAAPPPFGSTSRVFIVILKETTALVDEPVTDSVTSFNLAPVTSASTVRCTICASAPNDVTLIPLKFCNPVTVTSSKKLVVGSSEGVDVGSDDGSLDGITDGSPDGATDG
jgi:hypothetical protein